jgi:26S proteasome regulatory subunit N1
VEYHRRQEEAAKDGAEVSVEDIMALVNVIIPFHMKHNAEPEAVDLLIEVERLDVLASHVTEANHGRTCLYLFSCSSYLPEPEDSEVLTVAHDIFMKVGKFTDAMRVALRLGEQETMEKTFVATTDKQERRQLCYMLARHGHPLRLDEGPCEVADSDEQEELQNIMSNSNLSANYLTLARDLDVMEAKLPEDIYKTHLMEGRAPAGAAVDSARANLAATFVNAFVNAGFGQDKLLTSSEGEGGEAAGEGASAGSGSNVSWIFKNKDHGKMSAAASLGSVLLWDVEDGLPRVDNYLYSMEHQVVAGGLLAVGLINVNVRNDCDPAYGLLYESVNKENPSVRIGAIMGLGLAYAGTQKEEVQELLVPVVTDDSTPLDVAAFAALSLGLVFVGTCHEECVQAIVQALMLRPEKDLEDPFAHFLCLGLGRLFLQRGAEVEATLEVAKTLCPRISEFLQVTLEVCAYAGSGNVLKVQAMIARCGEHPDLDGEEAAERAADGGGDGESREWLADPQSVACLGVALIASAEDLGSDMAVRAYDHLIQYGDAAVRKAAPVGLALLHISNPKLNVTDVLGRLSHDSNEDVAQTASLALGIVGAGTNNARLAGQLRQLSSYYYKDPSLLFLVRVAQGLVHLGKGLLTLSPSHSDRSLNSNVALAGIIINAFTMLDMKHTILGKHHYMLYYLFVAAQPRMLMTVDEDGKPLPVSVRVGQAVDVVGQAGRPKTITGFQTHTTPVLLSAGDRAELATDKYIALASVLEGVVILKPNPLWLDETENA